MKDLLCIKRIVKVRTMKKRYFTMVITAAMCTLMVACGGYKFEDSGLRQAYLDTYTFPYVEEVDKELIKKDIVCIPDMNTINSLKELSGNEYLKVLDIGYYSIWEGSLAEKGSAIYIYDGSGEKPEALSDERIKQLEEELSSLVKTCPNLQCIHIADANNILPLNSLEFLAADPEKVYIFDSYKLNVKDYSSVYKCVNLEELWLEEAYNFDDDSLIGIENLKNLKYVNLSGTQVSKADHLLEIEKLNHLIIANTPLAENEEELNRIRDKYPNIKMDVER